MIRSEVHLIAAMLFLFASEGWSQDSWVRIFWATSHDGWTQDETGAWFSTDILESDAVPPDTERHYDLGWGIGSVPLVEVSSGFYAYSEGSFSSETELVSAWPV